MKKPSINKQVAPLVRKIIDNADALRVAVTKGSQGETLIDCGVDAIGGLEAGRLLSEVCLGGLGRVTFQATDTNHPWPFMVTVHTSQPVLACQATVESDVVIFVPEQKIERKLESDKTAQEIQVPFSYDAQRDQPLRKVVVSVTEPSMDDQTDDWSRLKRELARQHQIESLVAGLPVLKKLATALRAQPPLHDAALPAQ